MKKSALVLYIVLLTGCGGSNPAPNTPAPSQAQQVRLIGVRIAEETERALKITNDISALIQVLPISQASKDTYNCAILRVIGGPSSPTITQVCGTITSVSSSPLQAALARVKIATTCTTLKDATLSVLMVMNPLIAQLRGSTDRSIAFAGLTLDALFTYERLFAGGGQCLQ